MTHQHHEPALSLLQQLLLTGTLIVPCAANAAHAIRGKIKGRKARKGKANV